MKEINCTIKELFDAVSDLANHEFEHYVEYVQPYKIQVKDEHSQYIDVVCLITKEDTIRTTQFDDVEIKTANKHLLSYDGVNCKLMEDYKIGDKITDADGRTLTLNNTKVSRRKETVYDIQVDSDTHLYQTANKIIHHNTFAVQCLNVAFPERKLFSINLGATQDPRATLIGNTHFSKENGTYFAESQFVKAIQQEGTIVLLDELSRAHPEAMNILMTVLDEGQRYLRLDEADGAPTIKVAKGVSFIATANIGNEYTATRVLDRALIDRFTIIEMDVLTAADEKILLKEIYKDLADRKINAIAEIAEATRNEMRTDSPKISTILSTRATVELAGLLNDGFTLAEAAEVAIFPFYTEDGGVDSERTFVKMIVQKYLDIDRDEDLFEIGDDLDDVTVQSTGLSNAKPF